MGVLRSCEIPKMASRLGSLSVAAALCGGCFVTNPNMVTEDETGTDGDSGGTVDTGAMGPTSMTTDMGGDTSSTSSNPESGGPPVSSGSGDDTTSTMGTTGPGESAGEESGDATTGPRPCAPGFSTCGDEVCSVALSSDEDHCGGCFHSCGDGTCSEGLCQPYAVSLVDDVRGLAVDDVSIYVATAELVGRLSVNEPDPVFEVLHDPSFVLPQSYAGIAAAGDSVVVGATGSSDNALGPVHRVPIAGGPVLNLAFPTSFSASVSAVRATEDHALWRMSAGNPVDGFDYAVVGSAFGDGSQVTYYDDTTAVHGIALSPSHAYWLRGGSDELWRAAVDGTSAQVLADLPASVNCRGLAVGEAALYALCSDGSGDESVLEISLNGDSVSELYVYESSYWAGGERLEYANGRLLWVDFNDGGTSTRLLRWNLDVGEMTELATSEAVGNRFVHMAANDARVVFSAGVSGGEHTVWAVAE